VQSKKSINNKNPFIFIESIQMAEKKYKDKRTYEDVMIYHF
jgi:hypothetical protein